MRREVQDCADLGALSSAATQSQESLELRSAGALGTPLPGFRIKKFTSVQDKDPVHHQAQGFDLWTTFVNLFEEHRGGSC